MTYERKIAHLEEAHKLLEQELTKAEENNLSESIITDIKKKKLRAKDLIKELKQLDNQGKEFQ